MASVCPAAVASIRAVAPGSLSNRPPRLRGLKRSAISGGKGMGTGASGLMPSASAVSRAATSPLTAAAKNAGVGEA